MARRWAGIVICALAVSALLALTAAADAVAPAGPRLAILVAHHYPGSVELLTLSPQGEDPRLIAAGGPEASVDPVSDSPPSWSADGRFLAFATSSSRGGPLLAVADVEAGTVRLYPRVRLEGGGPVVIAPDGSSVAFTKVQVLRQMPGQDAPIFRTAVWRFDLNARVAKRLTPWRKSGFLLPSSFSPDGKTLAASSISRRGFRAVAIDLAGGRQSLLAKDAFEPTYSPDGSSFVFVRWRNWRSSGNDDGRPPIEELRVGNSGLSGGSRLLLRRRSLLNWPSWDPSGQRIIFTNSHVRENGFGTPEDGDKLMAVNADGTCPTKLFSDPQGIYFGAAWQPGVGREAGSISC